MTYFYCTGDSFSISVPLSLQGIYVILRLNEKKKKDEHPPEKVNFSCEYLPITFSSMFIFITHELLLSCIVVMQVSSPSKEEISPSAS